MANNYYGIANNNEGCVDLGQQGLKLCFEKEECNPTDTTGILTEVGDQWNCNLCQTDKAFWIPVEAGDTMQFQTQFIDDENADPENPTLGWGDWVHLEVCDVDGNVVATEATSNLVTRSIVAWSGRGSYQTVEIDFDVIDEVCFSIRFYTDDGQEVATQHFAKSAFGTCPSSVVVRTIGGGHDCAGNYYGDPDGVHAGDLFAFDNSTRIPGYFEADRYGINKTVRGVDKVGAITTTSGSVLTVSQLSPPWLARWLIHVLMGSEKTRIDGADYTVEGHESRRENGTGNMFELRVIVQRKCITSPLDC